MRIKELHKIVLCVQIWGYIYVCEIVKKTFKHTGDKEMKKMTTNPFSYGVYMIVGEIDNTQNK